MLRPIDTRIVKTFEMAIHDHALVRFQYGGLDRIAEPHILGVCRGLLMVLTYQVAGSTSSGGLPQWRLFALDKVENCEIVSDSTFGRRPEAGNAFRFEAIHAHVT